MPENNGTEYGLVKIKGKVTQINEFARKRGPGSIYEHVFTEPAKDEYEHPKSFPVRAERMLCPLNSVHEVTAKVRAWKANGFFNIVLEAVV